MAQLGMSFDATTVAPQVGFEMLKPDHYHAMVVDSEMRDTRSGSGQYLQLTWEVLDGPAKGRKLWSRLNLVNQNQEAVRIAQSELSAICHAVGVLKVTDSAQLHHKPCILKVGIEKGGGKNGDDANKIESYLPRQQAQAGAAVPDGANNIASGYVPQQAPAPAAAPPWQR